MAIPRRRSFAVGIFYLNLTASVGANPATGAAEISHPKDRLQAVFFDFSGIFRLCSASQIEPDRVGNTLAATKLTYITILLAHGIFHSLDSIAWGGHPM